MDVIFGIDPGSGSSSPTGLAALDITNQNEPRILMTTAVFGTEKGGGQPLPRHLNRKLALSDSQRNDLRKWAATNRIRHTTEQLMDIIGLAMQENRDSRAVVAIESFVMQGKGGETLQRLIGATLNGLPRPIEIVEIQNTTVKAFSGGRGDSDKQAVGMGLRKYFDEDVRSVQIIEQLLSLSLFDQIDAIAIALAGLNKLVGGGLKK